VLLPGSEVLRAIDHPRLCRFTVTDKRDPDSDPNQELPLTSVLVLADACSDPSQASRIACSTRMLPPCGVARPLRR
jgi:hypothetical protein